MNNKTLITVSLILLTISLWACGDKSNQQANSVADNQASQLPGDAVILARVNNEAISQYDLDSALMRMLGEFQTSLLDEQGRQKALESLVASKAIAQAMSKELSPAELQELDKEVQQYREKQLANRYLKAHSEIQPVTDEMVKAHYEKYPERYGAKIVRRYEMVFTDKKMQPDQRAAIMQELEGIKAKGDWKKSLSEQAKKQYGLQYRQGNVEEALLHENLQALMKSLPLKEASNVTFILGKPYMVRIVSQEQRETRPLQEVSAEIRKALVPVQLKKAVKQASETALKNTKVEYAK